jgi:hypothetical protein
MTFVAPFDYPGLPRTLDFWGKSVHRNAGSGYDYLSGWITPFCFWNREGKRLHNREGLELSEVVFPKIDAKDIPPAFYFCARESHGLCRRALLRTIMVAGLVGIEATSTPSPTNPTGLDLNSIRPYSGWWMFEVLGEKKPSDNKRSRQQVATWKRK